MKTPAKTCLVVLGMHRSGTSAFTGTLEHLGVNLGTQMLETQADNPRGFFENKYLVQANDCILETLGSRWDDTLPLPDDWTERFEDSALREDMRDFLRREMSAERLSAVKDPRLCRLLPLWQPLFASEAVATHFALVIRNPLEVAESLRRRNSFSTDKSLLLWLQYMLAAERHSRGRPRGFIDFDSLLEEPAAALQRLFTSARLELPATGPRQAAALTSSLDGAMRHHKVTAGELARRCPPLVVACYQLLCAIAAKGDTQAADMQALDAMGAQLAGMESLLYHSELRRQVSTPAAATADVATALAQAQEAFERDKVYRERRYIAHTRALARDREYLQERAERDRERLQQRADELERELRQFIGSPPWRIYRKYQETVEQLLPQGTRRRRTLQQIRGALAGPADGREPAPDTTGVDPPPHGAPPEEASRETAAQPGWHALDFPTSDAPLASIIVPVFNNWQFTWQCLQSVQANTSGSYELIVVDNHSSDETPALLAAMRGIHVISNEQNEVFVNACNQAAKIARGEYIVLLNNDTEVTPDWLPALLAPFEDPRTGVAGAKLVYPDGRLQEAGGIIWRDGSGCNYGHGEDPQLPAYNYRRAVDYCSGACLAIPRRLWRELGGFDSRYAPAYYEDTDLCFAVRALNYRVVYQPAATVLHYGGASAGKETNSGYKRYQEINRHKFVEKWAEVLEAEHLSSADGTFRAREKRGARHILIIDHHVPTFDRDSGSQRMLNLLQILCDMGWKVSFWPDDLSHSPRYTRILQDMGIETYYGEVDFERLLEAIGDDLDAVIMSRPATAQDYVATVKKYTRAQTIFDTVDLHFVREQRRLEREVQRWKTVEFYLAEETDTTLVVSPVEKELLAAEPFADKVAVLSNIHRLEPCDAGFDERAGLFFIGGFQHPPNEEGIIWFIEFVLPIIREQLPDIHLNIVGSDPSERLQALASDHINVAGYVEDVAPLFNQARVFVSPLLHGAGVKGKIGQSFSYGLPVVTTSIGAEGMSLVDGHNALIADTEAGFADRVVAACTDRFLWHRLSTNGRQVIREQFSFDTIRTALQDILDDGAGPRGARPVVLHCHLFKNAGTTLDWSLSRQFGERFLDHRDDEQMRRGASWLGPYLERHPQLCALSSHHVRFPLPENDTVRLLPIVALRHPIDRARSVYDFERQQQADTPGARAAAEMSFAEYIRWRLREDVAPTVRNFHSAFLTSHFEQPVTAALYHRALAQLMQMELLVIVERYDESMVLLEDRLSRYFPDIDLAYRPQNVTTSRGADLDRRVQAVYDQLGNELEVAFREANHWDMQLYEDAQAMLTERLGGVGKLAQKLENFRARCRVLQGD